MIKHLKRIPPKGKSFIAYKKVRLILHRGYGVGIATLKVPADAARVLPKYNDGKIRVSRAKVLKIEALGTDRKYKRALNHHPKWGRFLYEVGKVAIPKNGLCKNKDLSCGAGINVFITRDRAELY